MNTNEFIERVSCQIAPHLRSADFQPVQDGHFFRQCGLVLNVYQVQPHSTAQQCAVNLGIHFLFLPTPGTGRLLDLNSVSVPDCEIKKRLTPSDNLSDHWWPMTEDAIAEIASMVPRALALFERYGDGTPLLRIEPSSFDDGVPGLLISVTRVRAYLLLARLHEQVGDRDRAIAFAQIGLKTAGMAVGPRRELRRVLQRLGSPHHPQ